MKHLHITYLLVLLPLFFAMSQNIKGKVYDNEATVKGIKVHNISKQLKAYTDNSGEFAIPAQVNDTLVFESLFHNHKVVKLKATDFDDIVVFELKKRLNTLEEVLLVDENAKSKPDSEMKAAAERYIANDQKINPHLYMPQSSYSYGANFGELFKLIKSIFKNKKKHKEKPEQLVNFKTLDSLFKNDALFNLELLREDLDIPDEYAYLFFDYIETKALRKNLASEANKVILLDSLMNYSKSFIQITQDFEKTQDTLNLKN